MTVKDRMSSPAVTATPATRTRMRCKRCTSVRSAGCLVVDDQEKLLGIVTQRDLLEKGKTDTPVDEIMTRDPYTTAIDASIVHPDLIGWGWVPRNSGHHCAPEHDPPMSGWPAGMARGRGLAMMLECPVDPRYPRALGCAEWPKSGRGRMLGIIAVRDAEGES